MEIKAADGTLLHLRKWLRKESQIVRRSILLVHGLGEHGGRYAHVAKLLTEIGFDVWAYDHRGFGLSGGKRAAIPHTDALLDDLKLVFEALTEEQRVQGEARRPLLLGHSMGGAIVARAATGGWVSPGALILSSPGLLSRLGGFMQVFTRAAAMVLPNLAIPHGLPLDKISHDEAVLADAKADPLNHAQITPRLAAFILDAGERAIRDAGSLDIPVLVQAAGADQLVDVKGARLFAERMKPKLCTLNIYEGLWHEIYNEREPDRSNVLADLRNWLLPESSDVLIDRR